MNEQPAMVAAIAERYAQYYGDIRRHLSSEFSSEIRWLTASLFALNAGGLVTLAGKETLLWAGKLAAICFYLGIAFAFAYVLYSQAKTKRFLLAIQHIENCYVNASSTGSIDSVRLEKLEKEKNNIRTGLSHVFSVGSFVMFSAALVLLAVCK